MTVCEVNHICKKYPNFFLDDVSFCLEEGTVTGFIGRNGAGKTTVIKSMLNLIHTDGGNVKYFDMPYLGNENEIKQRISISSGAVNFYPKKRIKDICEVTKTFYKNWDENAYRRYLDMFSLDENKTPSELSEGMRVKCNLLFALSHNAQILILDEPTSGLDPFSRDELTDLFSSLKNDGKAILFSTHITSDIEKCADNIIYICKGKIVASDTKSGFCDRFSKSGETLEQTFLRLEREARNG